MDCLAVLSSGNYAFKLCRSLESKGFRFEVVTTPCQIAKGGCGYCLKFPEEYKDLILAEGTANHVPVREIYRVLHKCSGNRYERIF